MSSFLSRASSRFLLLGAVSACGALAYACSSDPATPAVDTDSGTSAPVEAGARDAAPGATDAGIDATRPVPEAGLCDLESKHPANGPGAEGADCVFNWDCQASLHCSSANNGTCAAGARGTLCAFATCTKSEDCASGACIESGSGGQSACTIDCDPDASVCQTPLAKCNAALQVCIPAQ